MIISLTSKLDKLIESKHVDGGLRVRLAEVQIKLMSRSKEDWENSRISYKM